MATMLLLLVLLLAVISTAAIQLGAVVGGMWLIHRFAKEKFPESNYSTLDFDSFNKEQLVEVAIKLSILIGGPAILFHTFVFAIRNFFLIPSARFAFLFGFLLLIFTSAALFAGLWKYLKIDPVRSGILTGINAVCYIILYYLFLVDKMY